jgi:2,3-bisphosphoglycerate-dependent phosphoglycerate mutase
MKKTQRLLCAGLLLALSYSSLAQSTVRIFVVRHADRESFDDLNPLGLVRAKELKRVLYNTGIDSIFSTDFVRTKKTAQPLATALSETINLYDSNPPLLQRIKKYSRGKTLLVVGHSNTVPAFIKACGCNPPFPLIPDNQFDNLFLLIMQLPAGKLPPLKNSCKLLSMKYGAPTPITPDN